MKKEKGSIIYYKEWAELLLQMPEELRFKAYDAINRYIAFDDIPDKNNPAYWVVISWINQIKRDTEKYAEKVEKRREAGKKGAKKTNAMRWGDSQQISANDDKNRQMSAKSADNDNVDDDVDVDDNDNDNVNVDDNKRENTLSASLSLSILDINSIIEKELRDEEEIEWYKRLYSKYIGIWNLCSNHYSLSKEDYKDMVERFSSSIYNPKGDPNFANSVIAEKLNAIVNSDKPFKYLSNKVCEYIEKDYKEQQR